MTDISSHSLHSRYRERVAEHLFLGELLGHAWARGRRVEVLRAETDSDGYDLVLECGTALRHVQLKGLFGANQEFKISKGLLSRSSGCVVVMNLSEDSTSLRITGYRFYSEKPGSSVMLDGRMKAEVAEKSVVKLSKFAPAVDIARLVGLLFPEEFR